MFRKVIAILLAIAAVATGVLWADSYRPRQNRPSPGSLGLRHGARFEYYVGHGSLIVVQSSRGVLFVWQISTLEPGVSARDVKLRLVDFGFKQNNWFVRTSVGKNRSGNYHWSELTVPLWFLFALFGVYPTLAFARAGVRRYRARHTGMCGRCGYNLHGNVSGICPECGEQVQAWNRS